MSEYTIQVKLPNGSFVLVKITAPSPAQAMSLAGAYGQAIAINESRELNAWR